MLAWIFVPVSKVCHAATTKNNKLIFDILYTSLDMQNLADISELQVIHLNSKKMPINSIFHLLIEF